MFFFALLKFICLPLFPTALARSPFCGRFFFKSMIEFVPLNRDCVACCGCKCPRKTRKIKTGMMTADVNLIDIQKCNNRELSITVQGVLHCNFVVQCYYRYWFELNVHECILISYFQIFHLNRFLFWLSNFVHGRKNLLAICWDAPTLRNSQYQVY